MKIKVMIALFILIAFGCCYFVTTNFLIKKIHEKEQSLELNVKKSDKTVIKETKSSKSYTKQEINDAKEYVQLYRYINKEINKTALKCVSEKGFDINVCEALSRKRYNMSNDPEIISRMDSKYKEQLKIVQSP